MKINIVAVGKIKEKYILEGITEYKKRLSRFCDFKIIEVNELSQEKSISKKIEEEGKKIIDKISGVIFTLDICGRELSSEELSQKIADVQLNNGSEITFVIGGSNGVSDEVKNKSKLLISFGRVTYPHQLFRLILTEQIYRAFTILEGMPYHK